MINWKIIFKILGSLLFLEVTMMLVCLGLSAFYGEDDLTAFIISAAVTLLGGMVFHFMGRGSENSLSRRDAYLVVTLVWIVYSLFGTIPFMAGGYLNHFTDAYFEMMSGFTTTGATIIDDVERLPHGILFWRTLSQWIGGLGIVFFTIALLPSMVGGSVRVFAAEATGPIRTKLHPKLSTNAQWLWIIYILLTVACTAAYMACGIDWFDGINYAMTSTATGGFSTHNDAALFMHSPSVEYVCTLFCFLSGVNFTLLYLLFVRFRIKDFFNNAELRLYLGMTLGAALIIMGVLFFMRGYDLEHAFRCGIFQSVSLLTTTGLYNDNVGTWPHILWGILLICMFTGACSGSTSGGFKCVRIAMIARIVKNEFRQILHPNAVLPLKVNGANVPYAKRVTLVAYLSVYLLLCVVMMLILTIGNVDAANALSMTLGCMSNVGPALSNGIGPDITWSGLPLWVKWFCSLMMLIGRLEVFSVLIIFTPAFWKER